MKKILFLIILIFALTGCTSYTELNDLSIVNTLGIDYIDNNYLLTLTTIERDNENDKINTFSSKKESLDKAINNIYLTSNKKIYLSHIDLLIITPDVINNKLDELLNNFLKSNEYRNNFQVIIMNKEDMNTFFNNGISSKEITNLIDINSRETSIVYKKELEEFIKEILIDNNSYLPTISFKNNTINLVGYTIIKNKKTYNTLSIKDSIILNIFEHKANNLNINDINIYHTDIRTKTNKNKIYFEIYLTTDTDNKKKISTLKKDMMLFLEKYRDEDVDILKLQELIRKNHYSYYKKNNDLLSKLKFKIKIINKKQNDYFNGGNYEK